MQIDIQARNFSLTDALRSHAERRLRFALTFFDDHIQRVVMRLSDINGPRGGADKRCHLQVVLDGLPKDLVNVIPATERDQQTDVVMATLSSFIEHEEQESQSVAERLVEGLRSQNLAVAGSAATLDALRWGEVDTLVMANDYQPDPGWTCSVCKSIGTETPETSVCPRCGRESVQSLDIKEAVLRLAGQSECPVEVVEQSDALMSLGGVGCLLRTHLDTQTARTVAPG